jgi:hypothetical protein
MDTQARVLVIALVLTSFVAGLLLGHFGLPS